MIIKSARLDGDDIILETDMGRYRAIVSRFKKIAGGSSGRRFRRSVGRRY